MPEVAKGIVDCAWGQVVGLLGVEEFLAAPFNLASVFVNLAVPKTDVRSAQAATYDRQLLFAQGEVRRRLWHCRLASD